MAIRKINDEVCTGCGVCVDDCPMDVLRMDEILDKAYVAYPVDCMVCYQCHKLCPVNAVEITGERARKIWFPF